MPPPQGPIVAGPRIHQSTEKSTDSVSMGPAHIDISLRDVLDFAKK